VSKIESENESDKEGVREKREEEIVSEKEGEGER
jgi:hypothetical protein